MLIHDMLIYVAESLDAACMGVEFLCRRYGPGSAP